MAKNKSHLMLALKVLIGKQVFFKIACLFQFILLPVKLCNDVVNVNVAMEASFLLRYVDLLFKLSLYQGLGNQKITGGNANRANCANS